LSWGAFFLKELSSRRAPLEWRAAQAERSMFLYETTESSFKTKPLLFERPQEGSFQSERDSLFPHLKNKHTCLFSSTHSEGCVSYELFEAFEEGAPKVVFLRRRDPISTKTFYGIVMKRFS
jgi:hypothetical protein